MQVTLYRVMSVVVLLSTCLTLSSCRSTCWETLKNQAYIYDLDFDHGVCGQNKITSFNPLRVEWVRDYPIGHCNGYFAVSPSDTQKIKRCAEQSARDCK